MILQLALEPITASNSAFVVPDADVAALGGGGRPKVVVTVGELSWRGSIARMGGRFLLGLRKDQFKALDAEVGRVYDVEIVLDEAPRIVTVPGDLDAALQAEPGLAEAWVKLSYTKQKQAAESLTGAKRAETRERRLTALCRALRGRDG